MNYWYDCNDLSIYIYILFSCNGMSKLFKHLYKHANIRKQTDKNQNQIT